MFKKLLVAFGVLLAVVVVAVIVAGIVVYNKVDKTFIASRMAAALNRQVYIEKIDVSVFSILSGIEIRNVAISNFKTPQQLAAMQGKPVAADDIFAGIEALRFKVKLLSLLRNQVELKELILNGPVINISRNRQGVLNIDDLMQSKKLAKSDPKEPRSAQPRKPLSADDIPVAIAVGEIGMKNGTLNYHDGEYDQKIQAYQINALAYDIRIDPKDLENKNEIKIRFGMGIKTIGAMKSGSVQSFDILLDATGKVIPFHVQSRLLDPEVVVHLSSPEGEITGLQLFSAVASVPVLGDYLGDYLSFLKGKQQWKGGKQNGLDLRYRADKAQLTNGRLEIREADILFDGAVNIHTKALDVNLETVLKKEVNDGVQKLLATKIDLLIKSPEVKRYADSARLAGAAMKPLMNAEDRIDLKAKVDGTAKKPEADLTRPQLESLSRVVQEQAGSLAVEAGKGTARQLLNEDQRKVLDDVEGLLKKK